MIVQTCRSWTLVTPGTSTIARATASASIRVGVCSMRIAVESRSTPQALATIKTAIASETSGSTSVQPVVTITSAATRTPTEPRRSAITCRNAASTLRLSPTRAEEDGRRQGVDREPDRGDHEHPAPEQLRRSSSRSIASQTIQPLTSTRVSPLTKAARISARWKPKLRRGVVGPRASDDRAEREADREAVREEVARVGEQREAAREQAADDLDDRHREREREDRQRAPGATRHAGRARGGAGRAGVHVAVAHEESIGVAGGLRPMRVAKIDDVTSDASSTLARMAKVVVQFSCSECGATTGRWLGRCPGCGAFGTLVEELHGRDEQRPRRARPSAAAAR